MLGNRALACLGDGVGRLSPALRPSPGYGCTARGADLCRSPLAVCWPVLLEPVSPGLPPDPPPTWSPSFLTATSSPLPIPTSLPAKTVGSILHPHGSLKALHSCGQRPPHMSGFPAPSAPAFDSPHTKALA